MEKLVSFCQLVIELHFSILKAWGHFFLMFMGIVMSAISLNAGEDLKELLYTQNVDKELALSFIGVPADKIETRKSVIKGELATPEIINLASRILVSRNKQSHSEIRSILHPESLKFIEGSSGKFQIFPLLEQLEAGSFLYLQENPKFFVTKRVVSQQELDRYFQRYQAKPDATIYFYHYNQEKGMLIGTQIFLVSEKQQYHIQLQIREPRSNNSQ